MCLRIVAGKLNWYNRQVEIHRKGPAKTRIGIFGEKCKNHLFYTIWVVLNLIGPDVVPSDAILTFKMAGKQDGRHQADVK